MTGLMRCSDIGDFNCSDPSHVKLIFEIANKLIEMGKGRAFGHGGIREWLSERWHELNYAEYKELSKYLRKYHDFEPVSKKRRCHENTTINIRDLKSIQEERLVKRKRGRRSDSHNSSASIVVEKEAVTYRYQMKIYFFEL